VLLVAAIVALVPLLGERARRRPTPREAVVTG